MVYQDLIKLTIVKMVYSVVDLQVQVGGYHFNLLGLVGYVVPLNELFHGLEFFIMEHHPSSLSQFEVVVFKQFFDTHPLLLFAIHTL